MATYFRITAFHQAKNLSAIFDSNGHFEKLWQFSAFLVSKGFKIIAVGADDKFLDGNISKVTETPAIVLRACTKGEPNITGNIIEIHGKHYEVIA